MKLARTLTRIAPLALLLQLAMPFGVQAANVGTRSLTLDSSAPGVVTAHTIAFTIPTTGNVGSIKFEYCTTAYSACVTPTGLVTTSASLSAQSGATGFTIVNGTNGAPYVTRASSSVTGPQAVSYTLSNVTNPSTTNTEYWTRITTYASIDTTGGSTDDGVVAWSTANQIVATGTMPESLVFCVGTSGTDCSNITGSAVALGVFSPVTTNTGTSLMSASTNAGFGYVITATGSTLTSGANTITAMGTQSLNSGACSPSCTSTTGTSQFGANVKANATPSVGANVTGPGTATGFGGYNTANAFRYFTGDTVASVAGVSNTNLFTNSYIVNVGGDQAAGVYTATMTYICTATF
jgi:hypothetical protein